jgi:hypothetical protein
MTVGSGLSCLHDSISHSQLYYKKIYFFVDSSCTTGLFQNFHIQSSCVAAVLSNINHPVSFTPGSAPGMTSMLFATRIFI